MSHTAGGNCISEAHNLQHSLPAATASESVCVFLTKCGFDDTNEDILIICVSMVSVSQSVHAKK